MIEADKPQPPDDLLEGQHGYMYGNKFTPDLYVRDDPWIKGNILVVPLGVSISVPREDVKKEEQQPPTAETKPIA